MYNISQNNKNIFTKKFHKNSSLMRSTNVYKCCSFLWTQVNLRWTEYKHDKVQRVMEVGGSDTQPETIVLIAV